MALIGVVIVNAGTINGPFWMDTFDFAFQTSDSDSLVTRLSFTFLVEKFYPLFALLFGISASLILNRRPLVHNQIVFKTYVYIGYLWLLACLLFILGRCPSGICLSRSYPARYLKARAQEGCHCSINFISSHSCFQLTYQCLGL